MKMIRIACACLACIIFIQAAQGQDHVSTQHNDLFRTGWYSAETQLNVNNVRAGQFGKIFTRAVDDQIYAQPLVMMRLAMPGVGTRNVVFVATVNNSVYAFDADSPSATTPYWQKNLTVSGARPPKNTDMTGACGGGYRDFSGNIGIVSTPAIDTTSHTMYVLARSMVPGTGIFQQWLHALDITTGSERPNSPVMISAQVYGAGDGSVGGIIHFDPQKQNQRSGILLVNGNVYLAFASHCDWGPYHGWVLGYDASTLQQKYVYNTTPNGYNGGIWMSGAAPAADESGNIYVSVGNGSVGNAPSNGDPADPVNRSESALKLSLPSSGNQLQLASFFTPNNFPALEQSDLDFGVTELMLIPGTTRGLTSCKDGKIYLLDRDNMGGYHAASNNVVQTIDLGVSAHLRSSFAYYKGTSKEWVYSWSENALLKAFPFQRPANQFDLANTVSSGVQGPVGNNGAFLAVSSNGSQDSTAILWASYAANGDANQSVRPGILRAFDANDVTHELWNSGQISSDDPGNYAKFNCPTVANGKVYLATFSNQLVVYGLTGTGNFCVSANLAQGKNASASSSLGTANAPAKAFDNDSTTSWASAAGGQQTLAVDLGARYDVCRILIRWGSGPAASFQVQSSEDSISWSLAVSFSSNPYTENNLPLTLSGRYLRIVMTSPGPYSIREFAVYGNPSARNCGTPSSVTASNIYESSATISWNKSGAGRFLLQYKTISAGNWTQLVTDTNVVVLTGLACSTDFLVRVQGICNGTDSGDYSANIPFSTLTCNSNCGPLPTRWTTQDIGDVDVAGSACYQNNTFELHGSGNDIWDTQDGFRFAYKTLVGDGELKAQVFFQDNTNPWNKFGLMFRETLTPGSRHAFSAITSGNGAAFQYRMNTDQYSSNTNTGPGQVAPVWLKLVKRGSWYKAFSSANGSNWFQLGDSVNLNFGDGVPVYAGLAITSHDNNQLSHASIDNFQFSGIVEMELQQFTATLGLNNVVDIQWTTTLEHDILNFVVERSTDNQHYTDLDTVPPVNNGRYTQIYHVQDPSPRNGFNYYRLRITNLNGSISYSAPAFVRVGTNTKNPVLFPNPARRSANVAQGTDPIKFVNVYDIGGRAVRRITNAGSNPVNIPISGLNNGVYVVQIVTTQSTYWQKLMVRN